MKTVSASEHIPSRRPLRITSRVVQDGPSIPVKCRYFAAGYCANGDKCRFQHEIEENDSQEVKKSGKATSPAKIDKSKYVKVLKRDDGGGVDANLPESKDRNECKNQESCIRGDEFEQGEDLFQKGDHKLNPGVQEESEKTGPGSQIVQDDEGLIDFRGVYESLFNDVEEDDDDEERYKMWPGRYDGRSYVSAAGKTVEHLSASMEERGSIWESRRSHWSSLVVGSPPAPSAKLELCRFHMDNKCRYGEGCRYEHGIKCQVCGRNAIHPKSEEDADRHLKMCLEEKMMRDKKAASADVDCCICMESPVALGRKFGLLASCAHGFCLPCIRQWRGSVGTFGREAVRHCPVCRRESFLVIPSDVYIKDENEKIELEEQYKSRLNTIPCKHFDFGSGICPFNDSCLYSHLDREGRVSEASSRPALLVSGSGEVIPKTVPRLAEYLRQAQ
eukprot:Plantae.Rhodophyta-Hildenbrandia_rubra.ctg353.p1 GENE.Plantae.Rhodophyta-Hildenbrandia_rubra.ctg353~~Plantae.Rhodophyta-Hildenbrandia_rubra.ctg353.p1  ORF type:complete len:446 (+),score=68.78 Plantae.Rhodophyta-Hildenbrandia_rubra.ctg353:39-1376(+)